MAKTDCGRDALHGKPSELDGVSAALHRLTEMAVENGELILTNQQRIAENRELILAVTHRLDDLTEKLQRLMTHLNVPYKPAPWLMKDDPSNGER